LSTLIARLAVGQTVRPVPLFMGSRARTGLTARVRDTRCASEHESTRGEGGNGHAGGIVVVIGAAVEGDEADGLRLRCALEEFEQLPADGPVL